MSSNDKSDLPIKIGYFASLAGMSIILGFSATLNKFKDSPNAPEAKLYEEGVTLAKKALVRGTIYSVCGFSLFAFTAYQLLGKKMIQNFRDRHSSS